MKNLVTISMPLVLAVLLFSCKGKDNGLTPGNSNNPLSPAGKYVGTWKSVFQDTFYYYSDHCSRGTTERVGKVYASTTWLITQKYNGLEASENEVLISVSLDKKSSDVQLTPVDTCFSKKPWFNLSSIAEGRISSSQIDVYRHDYGSDDLVKCGSFSFTSDNLAGHYHDTDKTYGSPNWQIYALWGVETNNKGIILKKQ